jgi:CheY-like chemotaxis protein
MSDRPTVLIIEDEDTVRRTLSRTLQRLQFQVVDVDGGEKAMDLLNNSEHKFHCVIVDRMMPGLSGTELIDSIRQAQPKMPIVLTTGVPGDANSSPNVNSILSKPWTSADVARAVNEAIAKQ